MQLYVKSDLPLEELAMHISKAVLPLYRYELREGLNLGGGEYYKYEHGGSTVLLVCNDTDHAEVFVESMQLFPYYLYVWAGPKSILEEMCISLGAQGYEYEIADKL